MGLFDAIQKVGLRVGRASGYPKVFQGIVNSLPLGQTLLIADSAQVKSGATLIGNIAIREMAVVESGARVVGDVDVNPHAQAGRDVSINGDVTIGEWTNLGPDTEIKGDTSIGKYNAIAPRCVFQSRDHFMHKPGIQMRFYNEMFQEGLEYDSKGPIRTGHDVWVSVGATILGGVSIGHGAIVGAQSVVTSDVEPYSIVAGSPAKSVGWRFDEETRDQLLDLQWWDWGEEKIRENEDFFHTDLRSVDDITSVIQ